MNNAPNRNLYEELTQRYFYLTDKRHSLLNDIDKSRSVIAILEEEINTLYRILCEHGNHVPDHFQEGV